MSAAETDRVLQIGCGRADITPRLGLPLVGSERTNVATGVLGSLQARVLLADDGWKRIAIVSIDLMGLPASEVAILRNRLAIVGDLDPGRILVACTHTHAAPMSHFAGLQHEDVVHDILDDVYARVTDAMVRALTNLQPVDLYVASIQAPGWAFNRRPVYAGGHVATHGFTWAEGFERMEDVADEELQVLLAEGRDGQIVGGLVNFACHPTVMESEPIYSSDYPGVLVSELESRHGGTFAFVLGACGDVANLDPATTDEDAYFGWDHAVAMGTALADRADKALGRRRRVRSEPVAVATTQLHIPQRRPTRAQVEAALWYLADASGEIDERAFTRTLTAFEHTFFEVSPRANERHARGLLGIWEWQRHAGTRETVEDVEVQAVTLGEVAIAAFPGEMFAALGRRLKAQSHFAHTFVATQANGWYGYIPTVDAFARGGYETALAYKSRLVPEAGNRMTDAALKLLHALAGSADRP